MKARHLVLAMVCGGSLAFGSAAFAQAAPAGSTGQCKDNSYTSSASKRGACKGHGGVKDWYASADTTKDTAKSDTTAKKETKKEKKTKEAKADTKAASTTTAAAPAAAAATTTAAAPAAAKKAAPTGMRAEAAPGGGAGKVWVNTSSNVYHCSGDEWYGKTKEGAYMTETEAKAKGAHASHGKACG